MKDKLQTAFAGIRADDGLINGTAYYLHMEMEKRRSQNKYFTFPKLAGAFAVMAVIFICTVTYNLYFSAYAHVSIDVNPSVEFTLNRVDRVIGAYAFNRDGSRILSKTDLRGKTYDEAAGLIISAVETDGYLTKDSLVSVTVQAANRNREQILCDTLQKVVGERIMSVQAAPEVEVYPVTADVWGNAHGCNMSPAKYLAIQSLMKVDEEATMDAYSDSTIGQIRRRERDCHSANNIESHGENSGSAVWNEHGHGNGHGHRGGW